MADEKDMEPLLKYVEAMRRILPRQKEAVADIKNAEIGHFFDAKQSVLQLNQKIIDGFIRYKAANKFVEPELSTGSISNCASKFLVISCYDSPVCASMLLDFEPGESFVVKNMASMIPPYDMSKHSGLACGIKFAVENLKVENIIVIGHSCCRGINGLMSIPGTCQSDFTEEWVKSSLADKIKAITENIEMDFTSKCTKLAKEAVNTSLANMLSYPHVAEAVADKKLALRGAYYNSDEGLFDIWNVDFTISPSVTL